MSHVITVINQKGGVGKTTTTVNIAAYLAKAGRSVLIVDADPQANATSGLGINKQSLEHTLYDVLFGNRTLVEAMQSTGIANLYVLPSNASLAAAEIDMVSIMARETLLKKALATVTTDYVLIDCPPSLGLLTINALVAAQKVLIPVQTEYYALEGLSQLLSVIQEVRKGLNSDLELAGVIMTMYDSRTSLSSQVEAELKQHFNEMVFKTAIPRNVRLAEAPSYGRTILDHDKWSKGARAYKRLTQELMTRLEN